jgi:hypothetical protein
VADKRGRLRTIGAAAQGQTVTQVASGRRGPCSKYFATQPEQRARERLCEPSMCQLPQLGLDPAVSLRPLGCDEANACLVGRSVFVANCNFAQFKAFPVTPSEDAVAWQRYRRVHLGCYY